MVQKYLDSDKVWREFGDEEDEMNEVMKRIREQNDQCTFLLTLACTLNKKKVIAPVTCPNTQ